MAKPRLRLRHRIEEPAGTTTQEFTELDVVPARLTAMFAGTDVQAVTVHLAGDVHHTYERVAPPA